MDYCLTPTQHFFPLFHGENKLIVLVQHAELDFNSASSLKQQSADSHVVPLGNIILIPSQPFLALSP
jgi:hypothetical protein